MREPTTDALTSIFYALSNERRRALRGLLSAGSPRTVVELVEITGINQPNLSKHLAALEKGQLVSRQSRGRSTLNSLSHHGAAIAGAWFDELFGAEDSLEDEPLEKAQLDRAFSLLASPWCRDLMKQRIGLPEAPAGSLQALMRVNQPEASRRLKLLQRAKLVTVRPEGSARLYAVAATTLWTLNGWAVNAWTGQSGNSGA